MDVVNSPYAKFLEELINTIMKSNPEKIGEECAERMNISVPTVKRISQRVNRKIEREI